MNKEIYDLAYEIEIKKNEIKKLVSQNKLDEAKAEKEEYKKMKDKFNTLFNASEEAETEARARILNKINNKVVDERLIKNAIYPGEKMKLSNSNPRVYGESDVENLDLGKLIKGMAGKGWDNEKEREYYYNSMTAGGNKIAIPTPLSESILDLARSQSAIFGNIPIIPMENNNMTIVKQSKDAEAYFVAEEELITESEAAFEVIKLYGKTLAILIPLTEQLLDSASNLTAQLENSVSNAIATALDKALIYGNGDGTEGSKEIKGIANYDDINKVSHPTDYDYNFVLKSLAAIKKNNIQPTNIVYNTDLAMNLLMSKDSGGQYIAPPSILSQYTITESNNVKDMQSLIFNKDSLVLGVNKDITIEYGHYGDSFKKLMKGLRVHLRVDLGVLRPKGVVLTEVKGLATRETR